MFVDGAWVSSGSGQTFTAESPATGEAIGEVPRGTREDARRANINESSNYWESHLPFGARSGTASGIGRVGGTAPMESFTELQIVVLSS
jgi:acyl-CoA reductase-like NAD-dependent aldehyde dehydrogenase